MALTYKILPSDSYELDEIELSLFASRKFAIAICELHNISVEYFVAFNAEEIWAVMPIFIKKKYGLKKAVTPILSYYNPICWFLPEQKRPNRNLLYKLEITGLIAKHFANSLDVISLNLSSDIKDIRSFLKNGFTAKPLYTFGFELHPDFVPNLFPKEGTSLRKAKQRGFDINEDFNPESFLELLKQTNQRQGRAFPIADDAHLKLLMRLHMDGLLLQRNACVNDETVSSLLILNDKQHKVLYAWENGTNKDYLNSGVTLLLHYDTVMKYRKEYSKYDLCGGNHPSISRFKAAMGAELDGFFRLEYGTKRIRLPKFR